MEGLVIRKATKYDAIDMLKYLNKVGGETDNLLFGENGFSHMTVEKEAEFIENINQAENSIMLIGVVGDEIVSIASLQGFGAERIAHRANIAVSVKREFWGNKIGTQIMKSLINFAKNEAKVSVIELQVKEDNTRAIQLYKNLGFEQVGLYKKFFKIDNEYFDALLMNLYF